MKRTKAAFLSGTSNSILTPKGEGIRTLSNISRGPPNMAQPYVVSQGILPSLGILVGHILCFLRTTVKLFVTMYVTMQSWVIYLEAQGILAGQLMDKVP